MAQSRGYGAPCGFDRHPVRAAWLQIVLQASTGTPGIAVGFMGTVKVTFLGSSRKAWGPATAGQFDVRIAMGLDIL